MWASSDGFHQLVSLDVLFWVQILTSKNKILTFQKCFVKPILSFDWGEGGPTAQNNTESHVLQKKAWICVFFSGKISLFFNR
jgi:hypothetical protein